MMTLFRYNFSAVIVVLASVFLVSNATAQTKTSATSLSTDEFLEYSLNSLRLKMDGAVEENRKLLSKNSSIRERILFLKKELRELDDQMISLREGTVGIKGSVKNDVSESRIDEKHLNNVLERKRQLELERDTVKKQIETLTVEGNLLEQDVQEASLDIQEMETSAKRPEESGLLDYYGDEKVKFSDMVKDYHQRIEEKRNKTDMLGLKMADKMRSKEQALREQESLERALADWELKLKDEEAGMELLKKLGQRWEQEFGNRRQQEDVNNRKRQEYRQALQTMIKDLKAAQDDIKAQFLKDEVDMNRSIAMLKEENELLFHSKKDLEDQALSEKIKGESEHAVLLLTDQQREAEKEKIEAGAEQLSLQDNIVNQQKINESSQRDHERLTQGIKDLTKRVDEVKQSVAVVREDAFGQKRAELEKAFEEQKMRNQKIGEDIAGVTSQIAQGKERLKLVQGQTESLAQDLKNQEAMAADLEAVQKDSFALQEKFSDLTNKSTASFRKEIEAAALRKKALTASLDVVNKKYSAEKDSMAGYEDEQAELLNYLEVLKKENMGLQKKLSDLKGL